MEPCLELNTLTCQTISHSGQQIIGFCIDPNCQEKNKFACSECFFDTHSMHKLLKIKDLNNLLQTRYKDYKQSLEKEKDVIEDCKKAESEQIEKIEKLKQNVIEEIELKTKSFIEELKNKFSELINYKAKDFKNLIEYENFFIGNAAPVLNPDHSKLSEICSKIYKESSKNSETPKDNKDPSIPQEFSKPSQSSSSSSVKKEKKIHFNKERINNEFNKFIQDQLTSIQNYIKESFLLMPENLFSSSTKFEWCNKTYSGYDFFYRLTNNNTKGIKFLSNGTMTVLRAKEIIQDNYIYKIKFKIGYKFGGDFDVGIGTDKVGDSCWLRTKESICISNTGVINMDLNMDNSVTIKDGDIINLEINTEIGKKHFIGYINQKLICDLDFDINNIYIMAAIRNNSNSIEVLEYDVSQI